MGKVQTHCTEIMMPCRINILVVGGDDPIDSVALAAPTGDFASFCTALGQEIIE